MKTSKIWDSTGKRHYRSAFIAMWSLMHYTNTYHITLIHRL